MTVSAFINSRSTKRDVLLLIVFIQEIHHTLKHKYETIQVMLTYVLKINLELSTVH